MRSSARAPPAAAHRHRPGARRLVLGFGAGLAGTPRPARRRRRDADREVKLDLARPSGRRQDAGKRLPNGGRCEMENKVRKTLRELVPLPLTLAVSLSLFGFSSPAASAAPASSPRKMEYLTRGLVAAQTPDGILLS